MLAEMESEGRNIRQNLKAAQDWKNLYTDKKKTYHEFEVGNVFHVSLLKLYVHDPKHVIHWQNIQVG